jgi:acrylyl-CoA reductase (NADPH)
LFAYVTKENPLMTDAPFRALRVLEAGQPAELAELREADLEDGALLVRVTHSSLNYKDGLAVLGKPGVVRRLPLTCGIDLAGEVIGPAAGFNAGDQVVLTGAGLSETMEGGYSEVQRVDPSSVVLVPAGLGTWGSMAVGTAGFTAMLCVLRLESAGCTPDAGPVVVTGATGGVGSFAVLILSRLGFDVHAVTGKSSEHAYLTDLGAAEIVDRVTLAHEPRALAKERWAAAVDSVGGVTLANLLSQIRYGGAVAACGLAGGPSLPATVMPFILRNVALLGVDSVNASIGLRREAWARLEQLFTADDLRTIARDADLEEVPELSTKILNGEIRGRVVVRLQREGR